MKIRVTSRFEVQGTDELKPSISSLMKSLLESERREQDLSEADVTAVLSERQVDITVVVDAESWSNAEARAESVILDAIRSIGGVPRMDQSDIGPDVLGLSARIQSTELVPA